MAANHYRPDIDGLRAIAVLLVILFHAKLAFTGGFVGVDVFFVISGFLITSLVRRQQEADSFSLADFWMRRIRRIIPAATFMSLAVLLAGLVLLFPADLEELAKTTIAQQTMVSNIYLMKKTGYFEGAADIKPLLHTWSLAVEEQFYLFYPFILVAIAKWRKHVVAISLFAMGIVSFALCEYGSHQFPTEAFFLLPFRAWELMLGGLIFFLPTAPVRNRLGSNLLGLFGVLLVMIPALVYNGQTRFPGVTSLIPCLGAAMIIYSNTERLNLCGKLLATRGPVAIGLISYSLYLWHWPLFAYSRYWFGNELPLSVSLAAVALSFVMGWASWKWIESPFRVSRNEHAPMRPVKQILATTPIVIVIAVLFAQADGFPSRVPEAVTRYRNAAQSLDFIHDVSLTQIQKSELPRFGDTNGKIRCLVWGDSHAMALMPGIDAACRKHGVAGFQATYPSTPPVLDFVLHSRFGLQEKAVEFNRAVFELIEREKIDIVILGGMWRTYEDSPDFPSKLRSTISQLSDRGVVVVVVQDVADLGADVPLSLARRAYWHLPTDDVGMKLESHRQKNNLSERIIREAAEGKGIVIDPAVHFVDDSGKWLVEINGEVLYRDAHHLSVPGGLRLTKSFEDVLKSSAIR